MTFLVAALVWALPSFLLHNVIHEGAHALVALVSGARNVKLWPFPGWRLGYFTWAHMTYDGEVDEARVAAAPVSFETVWFLAFAALFHFVSVPWLVPVFAVECVSSLVDMTVWFLGFWRPTENVFADASVVRVGLNVSRGLGKAVSLAWMLPLYALAVFLALRYAQNA